MRASQFKKSAAEFDRIQVETSRLGRHKSKPPGVFETVLEAIRKRSSGRSMAATTEASAGESSPETPAEADHGQARGERC
jgi:hypothetical protein